MSGYEKGDIVVVTADGWGHWASGGGGTEYRVGDELIVTSARTSGYVSVRPAPPAHGSVFKIPTSRVRPVPRMIGEVPAGGSHTADARSDTAGGDPMTAARILTVRQPWAWAIIHGGKTVENRVRNIAGDYRGPVLIHAAKAFDDTAWATVEGLSQKTFRSEDDVRGAIIGVVDLVDVHNASVIGGCGRMRNDCPVHGTCREHCSIWAQGPSPDGWFQHLVFENPRALDEPIPQRGALGLRKTEFFVSGDWLGEYVTPDPKHGMCTPYGCPPSCYSEPAARLVAT